MPSHVPGKNPAGFVKPPTKPVPKITIQRAVKHLPPAQKEVLRKRVRQRQGVSKKKLLKFMFWVAVIVALYLYWLPVKNQVVHLLQLDPTIWKIYLTVSHEITAKTLMGLFLTSFFGAIFFISIPVELIYLYYLTLNFSPWEVFIYVMIGNMLGMLFNYAFGLLVGPKLLKKWLKEKYDVWQKRTFKYGGLVLVGGNIIPSPIELVSVYFGGVRYPFTRFVIYTLIGKVIKFGLLYFGYIYFSEELSFFWDGTMWPWLLHMYEAYVAPVSGLLA